MHMGLCSVNGAQLVTERLTVLYDHISCDYESSPPPQPSYPPTHPKLD